MNGLRSKRIGIKVLRDYWNDLIVEKDTQSFKITEVH